MRLKDITVNIYRCLKEVCTVLLKCKLPPSCETCLISRETRLERNETHLARNEKRLARNKTRLVRNETRGGNLPLRGTVYDFWCESLAL